MIRKWLMTLLALMLAFALPMTAMADTQHTLSIIPGDELASEQAIADLLDVLSFTLTEGEDSGALSVDIDGESMLTFAAKADTTGLFVKSNILSDDVLYVTWEDGFAVLNQLATAEMDAEEAAAFQQTMEQTQKSIVDSMKMSDVPMGMSPSADDMALVKEMYADDPGMIEYIEGIYSRLVTEEGEFTSDKRDTATMKQTLNMTNDDLLAVCDTNMLRSMLEQTARTEAPDLTDEELTESVDAAIEEMREMLRAMDFAADVTVYAVDDGMTLVGMEMDMTMAVTEEDETESIKMKMAYDRLSDNNGVSHKASMSMGETDDDDVLDVAFDLYKGADGKSDGMLAMLADGEEITFLYNAFNEGDVRTRCVDLYLRSGASAIVAPAASARPLIGFQVVTKAADPAVLSAIETADSSNATNIMKLSAEEMEALMTDIEARAMQIVMTAMGSLPTSVLTLLMNTAQ